MNDNKADEAETEIIDVNKKRKQLQDIWSRTINLCDTMICDVEKGRAKIRASMVREIIQFLKLSVDVLDDMEKLNRKLKQQRWIDSDVEHSELESNILKFAGDEHSSKVPFPVDEELTLEDLGDFPIPVKDEQELKRKI